MLHVHFEQLITSSSYHFQHIQAGSLALQVEAEGLPSYSYLYGSVFQYRTLSIQGLIYAKKEDWENAASFYSRTAVRASFYKDTTWVGIAYGNLGNAFLEKENADSAPFYHRQNWYINNPFINRRGRAPEDAAKSALVIAAIFIQRRQPDSALLYIQKSQQLADQYINLEAEKL